MVKLSKYAKLNGICYMTAYRYFHAGLLKGKQLSTGTILIEYDEGSNSEKQIIKENKDKVVLYARVSSSENKVNLESQMERLKNYASAKGYVVVDEVKEIGSGLNDKRKKLNRIIF